MRRLLPAVAVFLALAPPASAAPKWLSAESPFGDVPALPRDAGAAMAPDGTVIAARFAPDGALEVRERAPGGPFGAPIPLERVTQAPPENSRLQVLTAADGSAALVFDAGGVEFASVRPPGGTWTRPSEASPAGGSAALAPDGVLSIVARAPDRADVLAVYRFVPGGAPEVTPVPATIARQALPAITAPRAGKVRVAFAELAGAGLDDGKCVLRIKVRVVDLPGGHPATLDQLELQGTGTADRCVPATGDTLLAPLLLAASADGSDTVVWTKLAFEDFSAKTLARHREAGATWVVNEPAERVGADVVGERLFGGAGDPVVVVRSEQGRALATRGADGTWTAPAPAFGFDQFDAARTGTGTIAFAFTDGAQLRARVFDPATGLGDTDTLGTAVPEDAVLAVGGDTQGDAIALVNRRGDAGFRLSTFGYDAAGPRVTALALPERPVAGTSAIFSATGFDVWSGPVRDATWDFGDGAIEDGLPRPHAYATGGRKTVTVRLRDAAGNETSASAALDVADAPPPPGPVVVPAPTTPPPPRDVRAPRLTDVSVTPRKPHGDPVGLLQFTTDEAGTLRVVLTKQARGVRSGGRCVLARRPHAKPCTRTVARRTVTKDVPAGAGRVSLPRLSAGTWKVRATVTDAAGNESRERSLTVRVR